MAALCAIGRGAVVRAALLGVVLAACGSSPTRAVDVHADGGRDGSRRHDAAPDDAGIDGGPPADPVLPRQAWTATVTYSDVYGIWALSASILIDARAESGIVRTVIGTNGRASTVVFDIPEPGRLVGRSAIDLGAAIPPPDCRPAVVRFSSPVLTFRDGDGDGIFETPADLTGEVFLLDTLGNVIGVGARFGTTFTPDVTAPTLTALPARPVALERLELVASEPLDAHAVPYVEAEGRRIALRETPGSSGSRWSLELSALPVASGYSLGFEGVVQDLAGNVATTLPTVMFDVSETEVLRPDGFETGLAGIQAEDGARELTGDEVPLVGARSAFSTSRTVVALAPSRSATSMTFLFRLHAETDAPFSPWYRVRAADGRIVAYGAVGASTYQLGTVAGFARQSDPTLGSLSFPAGSGPLTLEIDLRGSNDAICSGPRTPDDVPLGITLDAIEVR